MHNGMIKIVTGIRRCGKSYLLFELFKQSLLESGANEEHIIQVDLENQRSKHLFIGQYLLRTLPILEVTIANAAEVVSPASAKQACISVWIYNRFPSVSLRRSITLIIDMPSVFTCEGVNPPTMTILGIRL